DRQRGRLRHGLCRRHALPPPRREPRTRRAPRDSLPPVRPSAPPGVRRPEALTNIVLTEGVLARVDEGLEPELEPQEVPEPQAVVHPPRVVLVHQALDSRALEKPALVDARRGERVAQHRPQLAAQPAGVRDPEPALAAVEDVARQEIAQRLAQEPLAAE